MAYRKGFLILLQNTQCKKLNKWLPLTVLKVKVSVLQIALAFLNINIGHSLGPMR